MSFLTNYKERENKINSGIIIAKNSEYSRNVLEDLIYDEKCKSWINDKETYLNRYNLPGAGYDQGLIRLYYRRNINNISERSVVIPFSELENFSFMSMILFYTLNPNFIFKKNKAYIIHYAGRCKEYRIKEANNYYQKYLRLNI